MVSPPEPEESKDRDSDLTDVPAALYLGPGLDPPAGGMRMGHVLLVDDDEMNRTMISRLIQPLCVRLLAASDGSEAVWLMRRAQENQDYFDLVLLDYQMPNMDGPTTAQVLREMGYRGLIVGMTSRTRQEEVDAFIAQGANSVLSKPLQLERLADALSAFDQQRESQQSNSNEHYIFEFI